LHYVDKPRLIRELIRRFWRPGLKVSLNVVTARRKAAKRISYGTVAEASRTWGPRPT